MVTGTDSMDGGALKDPAPLEADSGLDLLFPLYSFLHGTGQEVVCRLLISGFRDAQYVQDNFDKHIKSHMTFYSFLCHINKTIKNIKEREKDLKKSKPKRSPSASQASCSNQQQHCRPSHHQQKQQVYSPVHCPRNQQHPTRPSQCTNQPQETVKGQHASIAQSTEHPQNKWPLEIQNLHEKEKILVKLTVGNLMQRDEDACQVLHDLDLNFVLNIILHPLISFRLDKKLRDALNNMKKVRQMLVHAKYNFTEHDFEENLIHLEEAMTVIHKALHLPEQAVQERVELCKTEAMSGNKVHDILNHLMCEAHQQYSDPDPSFVPPSISSLQILHKEVIEDLQKFIEGQQDNQDPILLCGEQREEKTLILTRLAFQAKSLRRFKLILYLKNSHRRSCYHQVALNKDTKKAAQEFQNQVFTCLANLVPNTLHKYGLDAVKTVIKIYQKNILFLINWNVSMFGPVQSEMQSGTWIFTYNAKEPPQGGWQILKLEPYTEFQVEKMLHHFPNSFDLLRCYDSFDSKDILSSWDMIQIFCEVSETICNGTDFEIVEAYVTKMVQVVGSEKHRGEQDLLILGKLAFNAVLNKMFFFAENDISDIQKCVCDSFLDYVEGEGWSFRHPVVRDLLAAKYVVSDSSVACKHWVKKDKNVVAFQRVFKFACFMWNQDNSVSKKCLMYMKTFLRTLFSVPDKKKAKHSERDAKSGDRKSNQMKKKEAMEDQNKHKNPFDSWNFLLELDEACSGEAMREIVSILSDIPCWRFNISDCLDPRKLTRLEKVLKKISLDKQDSLIIKLKSNANVALLTELWRKLRGIVGLYDCVDLRVAIEGDDASYLSNRNKLKDFMETIADTQVPLYITRYKGPLFFSCIPSFFKCRCMHSLEILEVSVYDVKSLCEVMGCGTLPSLREVVIKVNLELTEQISFISASIEFPEKIPVHITFNYFPNIQQLLDRFESCHRLCSLSIHRLYIVEGFKLNLSKFSNLESLNIRFEPEFSGDRSQDLGKDRMEMEVMNRLPRCHWMLLLLNGLLLPQKVERLLLRNVEFLDDANQCLIIQFFKRYNINRLLILDTRLSLTGVGKILYSQTEAEDDTNNGGAKRFRRNDSHDIRKLAARRSRISKEKRDGMKWWKPDGKEVVITSEGLLCADCSCFPCMCPSKVDRDRDGGRNSFERMVELINAMYTCNVLTFSYSFNQCTIRKDVCGDLRVQCIMKCLTDSAALEIETRSCLMRFFLPLMLAHCVILEETALSPVGVAKVAEYLRHIRGSNEVDPFSLTIETSWHKMENTSPFLGIKHFLETAKYLSVVHFRCCCTPKCFHIKKTYKGKIEDVI